ncbi:MAG: DUF4167 domain-containing protein [Henriciella sp.]|nr:DUF4167 domain-containing protein [Henriciella sp.]
MAMQRKRRRRSGGSSNNNSNNPNRHFESNGPDVRIRGSAQQILDKYMQYARDAQTSGDRVKAEALFQHAEHYARIVAVFEKQKEADRLEREARDAKRAEERAAREAERAAEAAERGEDANPTSSESEAAKDAPANGVDGDDEAARKRRTPRHRRRETAEADSGPSPQDIASDTPEPVTAETEAPDAKPKRRRTPRKAEAPADEGIMKTLSRGADPEAVASADGDG